jgi:hypothetical protein
MTDDLLNAIDLALENQWDGPLFGAVAGGVVAYALTREAKTEAEHVNS